MKLFHKSATALALSSALFAGCGVSQGKHDNVVSELEHTQNELQERELTLDSALSRIQELEAAQARSDASLATCERSIRNSIRETQESSRLLAECRSNLAQVTTTLSQTKSERQSAAAQSEAERQRMEQERNQLVEELNQLQAENRERQRLYVEMRERFDSLINAGQLDVMLVDGRLIINMPQDILFRSASADIGKEGESAILQVGAVLKDFTDRQFQVEGHTDNVPISNRTFPSNWELSSARALSVVHILERGGVQPKNLSAAGYGEHHPVASNESTDGRKRNRRIEIVILPNLETLVQ